jgi:hypothetical protein
MTYTDAQVLAVLQDILSFDRPVTDERMVKEARDWMLVSGHSVSNDTRKVEK